MLHGNDIVLSTCLYADDRHIVEVVEAVLVIVGVLLYKHGVSSQKPARRRFGNLALQVASCVHAERVEAEYFAGIRRCIKLRYVVRISSIAAHDDFHAAFSLKVWNKITVEISSFVVISSCCGSFDSFLYCFIQIERLNIVRVEPSVFRFVFCRNIKSDMNIFSDFYRTMVFILKVKSDKSFFSIRETKTCIFRCSRNKLFQSYCLIVSCLSYSVHHSLDISRKRCRNLVLVVVVCLSAKMIDKPAHVVEQKVYSFCRDERRRNERIVEISVREFAVLVKPRIIDGLAAHCDFLILRIHSRHKLPPFRIGNKLCCLFLGASLPLFRCRFFGSPLRSRLFLLLKLAPPVARRAMCFRM